MHVAVDRERERERERERDPMNAVGGFGQFVNATLK